MNPLFIIGGLAFLAGIFSEKERVTKAVTPPLTPKTKPVTPKTPKAEPATGEDNLEVEPTKETD